MQQSSAARFLSRVLYATTVAVAALLLIEGGWRVAGRLRTGSWPETRVEHVSQRTEAIAKAYRKHPFFLVSGKPEARLDILGHRISFDSRGYRGPAVTMPKPTGRYRVLCLGGSATFDLLATDDSATWPARLGALLSGEDADVVNAGFSGWTTAESLISLALRDVDVEPDLVIVFAGLNDLQPASHPKFARDYSVGHGELLPRVLGVDSAPLRLASRFVFIEWLLDRLVPGASAPRHLTPSFQWVEGARRSAIPDEAVEVYERNLRSTIAVAQAHGAAVLLVPQRVFPALGSKHDLEYLESWAPGLEGSAFAPSLARLAAVELRLSGEGLASIVDPFEEVSFSRDDFGDPMHFSPSGSSKFAAQLAVAVRSMRRSAGK